MTTLLQITQHIFIDQSQLLGKGSTGNVYLGGSYSDPGLKFAVKAIDLSEVNNEVTQYLLSCEIVALSELAKLNVEHVVKLHEVTFQEGYCYLVMELLEGGSLAEYIRENPNGLNEKQVEDMFRQLFQGYKAIRNLGIVHRDIKPDNIIFRNKQSLNGQTPQKQLCFIDFGYCTKQSVPNRPQVYYNVGSPKYMSPQAFKKNKYSQKSDMWALGVILYEMLHGKTIDKDMDMEEYMKFMEHNQIPFGRNVGGFLRNLVCGLLTFDVNKRISCDAIQQILNANANYQQNRQQPVVVNPQQQGNHHQFPQQQFIPQLDIHAQSVNKRTSNFYSSQIITHRSDPSQTVNHFHSHHHPNNQPFDPRRQQRNFSQQNDLHEFSQSPKKMIHLDHTIHRPTGVVVQSPLFEAEKRQMIEKFRPFEPKHVGKQFFNGPMRPIQRHLEKIEEEHDNQASRQNLMRMNSTVHNFRVEPDVKRSFLKAMELQGQGQGQLLQLLQSKTEIPVNPQLLNNPNVRFLGNSTSNNFKVGPGTPSRPQELVRSQIFSSQMATNDKRFNSGTNFFSSQLTQNIQPFLQANIKVVTSDKTINNRGGEQQQEVFVRNLNKSYSTNNVGLKLEMMAENNPALVHSRFVQMPFSSNERPQEGLGSGQQNLQNLRPVDMLFQNKEIANNRAFLRSTMPNVYRSSIQPLNSVSHPQPAIQQIQNLQNSKDLHTNNNKKQPAIMQQINHTNFKKHSNYFDQNFVTPQKQPQGNHESNLPHPATEFKFPHPFTVVQNRNQKSHSFKHIQNQQQSHTLERGITLVNLLGQSPNALNQPQLQFKQQSNQIIQQKQTQINMIRPQKIHIPQNVQHIPQNIQQIPQNLQQIHQNVQQIPQNLQQIHQQIIQNVQPKQQQIVQVQNNKNIVFHNVEQQQRNVIAQNNQQPVQHQQQNFQMLNLQQPMRNPDNQFRKSAIITLNEQMSQQGPLLPSMQMSQPHQRTFQGQQSQNQNMSLQEVRQQVPLDKGFFSQVSQPQRQILVNTINQNQEINRMIRPTYPLGNQVPVSVTQF